MSTDLIRIEEAGSSCTEIPDSSQIELVEPPVDARKPRRRNTKQINYRECSNSDSETLDATHEQGAGSEDAADDIHALGKITPVKTRSQIKKETENSEGVTPSPLRCRNTKKRSHDDDQSEASRLPKRGRPTTANSETKKFEKDALALVERFSTKSREFETIRSENDDLKRQIKLLESTLKQEQEDRLQKETAQSEDVHRLENDNKRLRTELLSALDEVKKDYGKYAKVPDSDIQEKWKQLSFNIRDTVSQCLTEQPAQQSEILKSLLNKLNNPLPRSDYDLNTLRSHILRRTLWKLLIIGIFRAEYAIWHGDSGRTLTKFLAVRSKYRS